MGHSSREWRRCLWSPSVRKGGAMIYGDNDGASRDLAGQLLPLEDGQFDIDGLTIGAEDDSILLDTFDPGDAEWAIQDVDNPFGRNTAFGRDYLRGPTWTLEAHTNGYDINDAMNAVDQLAAVWRAEDRKAMAGTFHILRYRIGSQTRRTYGRGRRFWHGVDHKSYSGTAPINMTFKLMENLYFDDEQQMVHMPIVPISTGGLTAPLTAPLTAVGTGGVYAGTIPEVGGTAAAPFHLYIKGPVSRPYVETDYFRVQLNMDLAHDQEVHVSTYAGRFLVEDNFGSNFAGKLSPTTRLNDARLKPGPASLRFGGTDITGTAWARIVWRSAYGTL